MKKFTIRLLIFCIAPLALLQALAYIVDTGLHKSRHFYYSEWNDIYDGKINADLIIQGTSRAWVHFSPVIIDSALGTNSYNLGMDAAPFDMQYERFRIYLRHNKKPKYILQEVGFNTTLMLSKSLPLYQQFLPYFHDSAIWRVYKSLYPNVTLVERYFPMYKYNNQLPVVKEGIWSYFGKGRAPVKIKGYAGQEKKWDSSFSNMIKSNPKGSSWDIEPRAVALYREFLDYCKANDIKVIMVYAPFYYELDRFIQNHGEVRTVLSNIAAEYNLPYLDYTHNYLDSSKQYFYNSQHLNKEGSLLFSRMLVKDLKEIIPHQ
jgi:hypothetical protein